MSSIRYSTVLIKLTGEVFAMDAAPSASILHSIVLDLAHLLRAGVKIAVVVGGGNWCRGVDLRHCGLKSVTADHMGMLATVMNGLWLRDVAQAASLPVCLLSAVAVHGLVPMYQHATAMAALQAGKLLILSGGTGQPFVTTDSAASLRAIELEVDILFKATKVDGVYARDPKEFPQAERYTRLRYAEVLSQDYSFMDRSALWQCQQHNMPLKIFNIYQPGALLGSLQDDDSFGTIIF